MSTAVQLQCTKTHIGKKTLTFVVELLWKGIWKNPQRWFRFVRNEQIYRFAKLINPSISRVWLIHTTGNKGWNSLWEATLLKLGKTFDRKLNVLPKWFLAALAALCLTLVSHSLSDWHFWILTQRVTFEWFQTKRQKDKKTKRQKDKRQKDKKTKKVKKTKRQKYKKKKERQKYKKKDKKDQGTKRQREKKVKKKKTKDKDQKMNLILQRQGSFALLRCF